MIFIQKKGKALITKVSSDGENKAILSDYI